MHWRKINKYGFTFDELLYRLCDIFIKFRERGDKKLKVRLWQAGDMPGLNNHINSKQIIQLVKVLQNFDEVFGYTHKPLNIGNNAKFIKFCNDNSIIINLSANNLTHADYLVNKNIAPVSVALPNNISRKDKIFTPKGRGVLICLAVLTDKITCATCGGNNGALCWLVNRDYIISFPVYGFGSKKVLEVASGIKIRY